MLSDYERELSTHYAQVRKRLRGEPPKRIMAIPPRPEPEPEPIPVAEPGPQREFSFVRDLRPVAHTMIFAKGGWIQSVANKEQLVPRKSFSDVLKEFSKEAGVPMRTILGRRRHRWIVELRRAFLWRAAHECPHLSIADIGRRAGVDHTTVLHALKRYSAINGLPYPSGRVK